MIMSFKKHMLKTRKTKGTMTVYTFDNVIKYYDIYCDICSKKYGNIPVYHFDEGENGFPEGDYCEECQICMIEQGFQGEDDAIWILKNSKKN